MGRNYVVTAALRDSAAGADLQVFLVASGGCEALQSHRTDSVGNLQVQAADVSPGTYHLVVDGFFGSQGDCTREVICTPVAGRVYLPMVMRH